MIFMWKLKNLKNSFSDGVWPQCELRKSVVRWLCAPSDFDWFVNRQNFCAVEKIFFGD